MDVEIISKYVKARGRYLRKLELSNAVPADLAIVSSSCRQLTSYTHSHAHFNQAFATVLLRNKHLQELRLNQLTFNPVFVMPDLPLPLLSLLSVRNSWCNDNILGKMVRSSSCLLKLDLHNTKGVTDAAMLLAAQHCPRLTALGLGRVHLRSSTIVEVCSFCPSIRHLDLLGLYSVSDETIQGVVGCLAHLQSINLQGCAGLTDIALLHLAHRKATLDTIYIDLGGLLHQHRVYELLYQCPMLSALCIDVALNETIHMLHWVSFANLSHLTVLSLRSVFIPDKVLLSVAEHCAKLQCLDLRNTSYDYLRGYEPSFTRAGLLAVVQSCLELHTLVVVPSMLYDPAADAAEFALLRPGLRIVPESTQGVFDVLSL